MDRTWKFLGSGILIHTLELVTALYSFPICLYREAIRLQCFPRTRYVKNGEYPWCALFTVHPRCIMWFSGLFFLLSVHASLEKKELIRPN